MASGGGNKRPNDPKSDDPSIVGISNSDHGNSGRQNHQKVHPSTHPGATRHKQDYQTPQQHPQTRRQNQQQRNTPISSDNRRQEHWKVPPVDSHHSPLAKDLFGAENDPQFDVPYSQNDRRHGNWHQPRHQHPDRHYGGRGNQNHGRYNQGPVKHESQSSAQSSKVNYRQHNGGTPQQERGAPSSTPKTSEQNQTESERKVQFIEKLMKNGEKTSNLTITVGPVEKNAAVVAESKTSDGVSKLPAKSLLEEALKKSPANKFANPLMEAGTSAMTAAHSQQEIKKSSSQTRNEANDAPIVPETSSAEKPGKKKKKNKGKKKKKERIYEEEKASVSRQSTFNQPSTKVFDKTDARTDQNPSAENQKSPLATKNDATRATDDGATASKKTEPVGQSQSAEKKTPTVSEDHDANVKKMEELGLEQAEKRLEKDLIFKLEKRSPTFPEANYFCKLCSHHLNTVAHAHKHIKDKRHKRESKAKQQDELLRQLKCPPAGAVAALDRHLAAVISKQMMSQDDAKERKHLVERLNEVVSLGLPGCSAVLYGSSVTTIGLKSSDLNVDVQYHGEMRTPAVLMELLKILKNSDKFTEVQEDFDAKVPRIDIKDTESDLRCLLSVGNIKAVHTTRLVEIYGKIEPDVIKLSMLYRLWGHLCQVDRQQDGSLPPHSFTLMTIFYLQQKHRLPVLHEVLADHDIEKLLHGSDGADEVLRLIDGEWWYYPTAPPADKKEDVEEEVDETAEFSESDDDLEVIFSSESPVKDAPVQSSDNKEKPLVPVKVKNCFDDEKTASLAELWLGLLKFYSAQFDMENMVISVRSLGKVTRSDRGWSHRRIAVEDPCSPKWNLCKPMNSQALFNYFLMRLKHTVFYFHTAHNSIKNKTQKIIENRKNNVPVKTIDNFVDNVLNSVYAEVKAHNSRLSDHAQSSESKSVERENVKDQQSQSNTEDVSSPKLEISVATASDVTDLSSSLAESVINDVIDDLKTLDVSVKDDQKKVQQEDDDINYDACYKFTKSSLMDGKVPIVICSICKKEGHRKKNCPDEVKIKVNPLPPFTDRLRSMLDRVCREIFEIYVPMEDEVRMRESVCSDLFEYLRRHYDENVKICLFGSSRNRFTFRGSDLDICMTFDGNQTGEDLDYTKVIEGLAKILRRDPNLRHIIPITTAKVPIIKFYHPKANLEGDISLYNLLAQRNTSMVALYASIDERCRMLGYAMKAFVKRCCIGDASRGSLSSYAYILLVIYFLQQRETPVLPVLQELYNGDKMPEHHVDGWNSWFYDSIGLLDKVWPDFGKNQETLGELWIGMLRFYTEKFDFSRHVVSIRQKKLLTAFEKEWTSKCICIEDPFDLNHNLGAGVSRKMTNFILKVFVKARERFGTEPSEELNGMFNFQSSAAEYFFNAEFLMDGQEVPNDRCCRVCGKIGHFVKDCPKRRQRRKNGDDQKLRDVDCFGCGKRGHFKKDCPEAKQVGPVPRGSPLKDIQFLHGHPLQQMRIIVPGPHHHMLIPPLMQNIGQGSPIIVQAKRQEQMYTRFSEPQPQQKYPSKTPQKPQENPAKRQPNSTSKDRNFTPGRRDPQTHSKTPQSGNKGHQGGTSPHPSGGKAPLPSSGPNSHPPANGKGRTNPRQSVNRKLASDFESDQPQKNADNPSTPRRSTSDPVRQHGSSNTRSGTKHQPHGESPSPGTVYTVKEIESQMLEKAKTKHQAYGESPSPGTVYTVKGIESQMLDKAKTKHQAYGESPSPGTVYTIKEIESEMLEKAKGNSRSQEPKVGESLNHLIPRQGSNEELCSIPSPNYPVVHLGYPRSPPYPPQFGMPPVTPPMFPPQYMAPYSISPQNMGNPLQYHPHPDYQRSHSNDVLSRTPPSPMGYHFQGYSPPHPGYGYPQQQQPPNRGQGSNVKSCDPQGEPVSGRTFVNSNQGSERREVHFTGPKRTPTYRSYPPDQPHPGYSPHGQPQYWNSPNARK